MEDHVDDFVVYRARCLPTRSISTVLCYAASKLDRRECLCQVVDTTAEPLKPDQVVRACERLELLRQAGFPGYFPIRHYRVRGNAVYVFFGIEGPVRTFGELLASGVSFSNIDLSRVALLMLDSYRFFYDRNLPQQDLE